MQANAKDGGSFSRFETETPERVHISVERNGSNGERLARSDGGRYGMRNKCTKFAGILGTAQKLRLSREPGRRPGQGRSVLVL